MNIQNSYNSFRITVPKEFEDVFSHFYFAENNSDEVVKKTLIPSFQTILIFSFGAKTSLITRQNTEITIDTFLRPNLYMQGLLAFKETMENDGKFYAPIGEAKVSIVDIRDIASVAALALTEDNHQNMIYNITGPQSLTHYQMADAFSESLGKRIEFIDITSDQMRGFLQAAGFPEWQIEGLIEDYAHYARGEAAEVYNTVKDLTGKDAISFAQFVNDYKSR